jgi:hypothetical protein
MECVLRRRSLSLEHFLHDGCERSANAFERCGACAQAYDLPAVTTLGLLGVEQLPHAWVMVCVVWIADASVLLTLACLLARCIALPARAALAAAILVASDVDGSGSLDLEEAMAYALRTGDQAGASALPSVIRTLPPVGSDELNHEALRLLYLRLWAPRMLAHDAAALGVIAPCISPRITTAGLCAHHLCTARAGAALAPWAPATALLTVAGTAGALLIVVLGAAYCLIGRARLVSWLMVHLCDLRAVQLSGRRHSPSFWQHVIALGGVRPRTHACLLVCALSASAQWAIAGEAWARDGRLAHPSLLLSPLWPPSATFLLAPLRGGDRCAPEALGATWPEVQAVAVTWGARCARFVVSAGVCVMLAAADILLLPAAFRPSSNRRRRLATD